MNDGALATDVGRLYRKGPNVRHHKRNGYAGHPQIPKHPRTDKECSGEELSYLPKFDRDIENGYGIENDENDEPDRQREEPHR